MRLKGMCHADPTRCLCLCRFQTLQQMLLLLWFNHIPGALSKLLPESNARFVLVQLFAEKRWVFCNINPAYAKRARARILSLGSLLVCCICCGLQSLHVRRLALVARSSSRKCETLHSVVTFGNHLVKIFVISLELMKRRTWIYDESFVIWEWRKISEQLCVTSFV